MSSIKSLEMAAAVSENPNIEIKKSLFSTKAIYTPTQSKCKAVVLEYSLPAGERVQKLLNMPAEKMADDIEKNGKPVAGANGNFRLELCISDDNKFCAFQLFRFGDFRYKPVSEPCFYEGKDVEAIAKLL